MSREKSRARIENNTNNNKNSAVIVNTDLSKII
jgi:hypothetical protein